MRQLCRFIVPLLHRRGELRVDRLNRVLGNLGGHLAKLGALGHHAIEAAAGEIRLQVHHFIQGLGAQDRLGRLHIAVQHLLGEFHPFTADGFHALAIGGAGGAPGFDVFLAGGGQLVIALDHFLGLVASLGCYATRRHAALDYTQAAG